MSKASLAAAVVLLTSLSGIAYGQTSNFMTQEGSDQWRASKLSGVAVFGPDNKKVGNITDVLMNHDGKASAIVIGVGGFLGLGEKDVAVPFDQVKFTDQPMAAVSGSATAPGTAPTSGAAAPAATGLGMPANTAMAGSTTTGMSSAPGATASNPANGTTAPSGQAAPGMGLAGTSAGTASGVARSTSYPDHGTIDLTADQLKSAPSFQFAK